MSKRLAEDLAFTGMFKFLNRLEEILHADESKLKPTGVQTRAIVSESPQNNANALNPPDAPINITAATSVPNVQDTFPTSLNELFARIQLILNLSLDEITETVLAVDPPTVIDRVLKWREELRPHNVRVDTMVEMSDANRIKVIFLSNLADGPVIVNTEQKGFGLFAERNYASFNFLTTYSCLLSNVTDGDYSLQHKTLFFNPEHVFATTWKGRWINTPIYPRTKAQRKQAHKMENCITKYRNSCVTFYTKNSVRKYSELLWDYGDQYN